MAKKTTDTTLETGILSFERSIQIAEAVMFGLKTGSEEDKDLVPIEVVEKGVRGQSSEAKAKNPGNSNPQAVEAAYVPQGCDAALIKTRVRIMAGAMSPHACDTPAVGAAYRALAAAYAEKGGFRVLAELYAWNMANGRFAWRNRFQADDHRVIVEFGEKKINLHSSEIGLHRPASVEDMAERIVGAWDGEETEDGGEARMFDEFISRIEDGLKGVRPFSFDLGWIGFMEAGQEVFPSQEYLREDRQVKNLSRVYAAIRTPYKGYMIPQASIHSQKIGAAIRHIDIWHGSDEHGAIAVNPYGGVQGTGEVLRDAKGRNFYTIRKDAGALMAAIEGAADARAIPGDVHFFMANLVRGGVFGVKSAKSEG